MLHNSVNHDKLMMALFALWFSATTVVILKYIMYLVLFGLTFLAIFYKIRIKKEEEGVGQQLTMKRDIRISTPKFYTLNLNYLT